MELKMYMVIILFTWAIIPGSIVGYRFYKLIKYVKKNYSQEWKNWKFNDPLSSPPGGVYSFRVFQFIKNNKTLSNDVFLQRENNSVTRWHNIVLLIMLLLIAVFIYMGTRS